MSIGPRDTEGLGVGWRDFRKLEPRAADLDDISVAKREFIVDSLAVDKGSIAAEQIFHEPNPLHAGQDTMTAAAGCVLDDDTVFQLSSNTGMGTACQVEDGDGGGT